MKFKGYLFVTDMDNTLLCEDHTLSVKNKEAIDYFINNGGYFTVATGRALPAANEFVSNRPGHYGSGRPRNRRNSGLRGAGGIADRPEYQN